MTLGSNPEDMNTLLFKIMCKIDLEPSTPNRIDTRGLKTGGARSNLVLQLHVHIPLIPARHDTQDNGYSSGGAIN
jgi:hypothetical protein